MTQATPSYLENQNLPVSVEGEAPRLPPPELWGAVSTSATSCLKPIHVRDSLADFLTYFPQGSIFPFTLYIEVLTVIL